MLLHIQCTSWSTIDQHCEHRISPHNAAINIVWCRQPGTHLIRLTPAAGFCLSCGLPPTPQALLHALRRRLPAAAGPLLRSL